MKTQTGQDLIKIGEERGLAAGRAEGLAKAVGIVLEGKRRRLTKGLQQRIRKLTNDQLCQLLSVADAWESLDPPDA